MKIKKKIQNFFLSSFSLLFLMIIFPDFSGGHFKWNLDSFKISSNEPAIKITATNSYFFPNILSLAIFDKKDFNQVFFMSGILAFSSEGFFITKSEDPEKFLIWQRLKREQRYLFLGDYNSQGLPFFIDDRLFQISENNTNIKEVAISGKAGSITWEKVLPSSLLTVSANKDTIILGLSSGVVWILNLQGDLVFSVNLNQKEDSLISAVKIFSYQNKEYFIICQDILSSKEGSYSQWHLYEKTGKDQWDYKLTQHMGNSLQRERKVIFDNKGYLFLETDSGTDVYDLNKSHLYHLSFHGILINGIYTNKDNGILVIYDLEKDNIVVFHFSEQGYLYKKVLKISSKVILDWSLKQDEFLFYAFNRPYLWKIQIGSL